MYSTVQKILDLLTPKEKRRGLLVLLMVLLMALVETAGVASVMPFLAVLGNPGTIETNQVLSWLYAAFGFSSTQTFLIVLGVGSFMLVVIGAIFRLVTLYALYRYANMRRHAVGERLLKGFLRQPYEFFLSRNTADLSKTILSEVDELTRNVFQPGIQLVAYSTTSLVLVAFLFFVDPAIALGVTMGVGIAYIAIYLGVRGVLMRVGRDRAVANRERFTAASEVLGGIKDLKVLGREEAYLPRFKGPSARYSRHQATNSVLSITPKYLIEAIGFGGVLVLALILMATRGDLGEALPVLGLYAFAGYRLLPSAQHVFASLAKLRFGLGAVEVVHADLMSINERGTVEGARQGNALPINIERDIRFCNVTYHYPGSAEPAVEHVDLRIAKNSFFGIVGTTGAGKTTFVDLLLGLLRPTHGSIHIDGRVLNDVGVPNWQRSIGYIPQQIYLADASIAENIALGIAPKEIDREAVARAATLAQLRSVIERELPDGYETIVGERGVRLSGGQRQRIGIARALYHDPAVLVLDEATSALDNATEAAVMGAVGALQGEKTVIVIAHRLSTVRTCDCVAVMRDGRIVGSGTYDELIATDAEFKRIVSTSNVPG
jgi:ATP-binding cassette, subfamily B, bacterial PglK